MSPIVWVFQGGGGHSRILKVLVERYANDLGVLLPRCDSDDPLVSLQAELEAEACHGDVVTGQLDFERFFPLALTDVTRAMEFRTRAVTGQARNRLAAAQKVLADLGDGDRSRVSVSADNIDAWVQVLSAIRVQWHVDLTGSSHRLAEPTAEQLAEQPDVAVILDWLALLIEDALHAKWRHQPPRER